jgi:hypothetical protein
MFSGDDLTFPKRVLDLVATKAAMVAKKSIDGGQMETFVKEAFELCWERDIEDQILKPNLLTKTTFTAQANKHSTA